MTKEEKIKEAWGEYYDGVKQYLSDSGFPEVNRYSRNYIDKNISKINQDRIAEKLTIINHNNGWIKIESEDDLPKEEKDYWVVDSDGEVFICFFDEDYKAFKGYFHYDQNGEITHYQPIEIPKSPLY